MGDNDRKIAEKFNIMDKVQKLESDLLKIEYVTEIDFDLNGFLDNMKQVIFTTKHDIPVSLEDYYTHRAEMIKSVIEVCARHGLSRTGDMIEDYGEHLYFVFKHDSSWNITQ